MLLKIFRATAILEGLSYLMLFGVSIPLKYLAQLPKPNIYIGNAHGILFIAFVLLSAIVCWQKKWRIKRFIIFFIASLLPLGTFYIDQKYLKTS